MNIVSLARQTVILPFQVADMAYEVPTRTYALGKQAVNDIARALDQGRLMAARAAVLLDAVEILVADIAATTARASSVVTLANAVAVDAAVAIRRVETQLDHTGQLIDSYAPLLAEAQPTLSRAADALQPRHVDAIAQLLELTPEIIDLITPALQGLGELTPELDQLAERFETIGQIVEGIPGAKLLKRRGTDGDDDTDTTGQTGQTETF